VFFLSKFIQRRKAWQIFLLNFASKHTIALDLDWVDEMLTTVSLSLALGELDVPLVHPVLFPYSKISDLEPFDTRVRRSDDKL
jgi:hypothetical protein